MITSRVRTSANAIMTRAATQAADPVMWLAMLKLAMAGPAPLLAATAKANRAPTPQIHMPAASQPRQRPTVGTEPQPGGQAADRAHGRTAGHASQLQRDVAAAEGHRVQEQDGGGAHGENRDGQRPQVERVLADLADDHEDEDCVDHVHVDVHAVSVPRGPGLVRRPTGGSAG